MKKTGLRFNLLPARASSCIEINEGETNSPPGDKPYVLIDPLPGKRFHVYLSSMKLNALAGKKQGSASAVNQTHLSSLSTNPHKCTQMAARPSASLRDRFFPSSPSYSVIISHLPSSSVIIRHYPSLSVISIPRFSFSHLLIFPSSHLPIFKCFPINATISSMASVASGNMGANSG